MKRIWIAGCAGSGKTTLAKMIGEKYGIPVYHRDSITWDENDAVRSEEEQITMLKAITEKDKWIFEGARFTASKIDGRLDRCDTIIHLDINRFLCLYRGLKRAHEHSKIIDITMADRQPFHFEHICGVLFGYPKKRKQREAIFKLAMEKGINVIILKSRKEVKVFFNQPNSIIVCS